MSDIVETHLPWPAGDILDLAALDEPSAWLVVDRRGGVHRLDADSGVSADLCFIELPPAESDRKPWFNHPVTPRLHVAPGGAIAAIVNDYGRYGRVYDLRTGSSTLALDGGDYHVETVPFSFAFVRHGGRVLAIHRTAWNRLDVSDAASGSLLSARGPTRARKGEEPPPHYLDYFHGRLVVSPGGARILDDGWVWHPVGIPAVWRLDAWLDTYVWESEDGPSRLSLPPRDHYWDRAMCWLDAYRIALGGLGDDEDAMVDGARIFAVAESRAAELGAFAGPAGEFFSDGERLFSADEAELSVWDVESGARTAHIEGFRPTRQHVAGRELVEPKGATLRRLRY